MGDREKFLWYTTTVILIVGGLAFFLSGHYFIGVLIFIGLALTEITMRMT